MLKRLRRQEAGASAGTGVLLEQTSFGPNAGQLRMRLHVPAGLPATAPLVVVLHGCTQGAEAFAVQSGWIALAKRLGFAVLAPEQTAANNPNRCFNWFHRGDATRGHGEAASIADMIAYIGRTTGQGRDGAFITGLSAGGAMTAVMLATYPELFIGGAVVAGLPYGAAHGVSDALRIMSRPDARESADLADLVRRAAPAAKASPKLSIWHGQADTVVHVANANDLARQWAGAAGLGEQPDATMIVDRTTRSVWRDADGDARIELNLVRGLGHGVPLSTIGEAGVGATAPYMIEAGISSSLEIARFWGLAQASREAPEGQQAEARMYPETSAETPESIGDRVLCGLKTRIPAEVEAVIAKAFRAAGLMS